MQKLRLMSQNMWSTGHKNLPAWEEMGLDCTAVTRMKGHFQILKELMPDVLGCQECNGLMQQELMFAISKAGLPYAMLWGNETALLYRADKLEVVDSCYFLYPKEIDGVEGSFNNGNTKGYNLGLFRSKETGKTFLFGTTHLWWKHEGQGESWQQPGSNQARRDQIEMLIRRMEDFDKQYGPSPKVIVGDLNCQIGSLALNYALGEAGYAHAHDLAVEYAEEGAGYCRCGDRPADHWEPLNWEKALDHVLIKDAPEGWVRRLERYTPDCYLHLSDHAPVYVDVEM